MDSGHPWHNEGQVLHFLQKIGSVWSKSCYIIEVEARTTNQEAKQWINAVINGTNPTVLPEQAYCVTQILEGIYESAKTGKPYYFN